MKIGAGFSPIHLVYGKEAIIPIELEVMSLRMLSKLIDDVPDYLKERLVELPKMHLDRSIALEHYEQMQDNNAERINVELKDKDIGVGDLVLRYNSKLDKTFQKKFQIKWEGPFRVVDCFPTGTYQLEDLTGLMHGARVNGSRLKKYVSRLMTVVCDDVENAMHDVSPQLTVEEDLGPAIKLLFEDDW